MIRSNENYRNETLAIWDLGIQSKEISWPGDEVSKLLQNVFTCLPDHSITFKTTIICRLLKCLLSVLLTELVNPLNVELNPICHLLVLLGACYIHHVSRIRVNYPRHPSTEVRRDIQGTEVRSYIFLNHNVWIIWFTSCLPCTLSNHPSQLIRRMNGIQTTVLRIMKITKTLVSLMRIDHRYINNSAITARISTNIYV